MATEALAFGKASFPDWGVGNVSLNPTAQPSFLLIGLLGEPKVTEVKLYACWHPIVQVELKPKNFGAGTKFHVVPS
jgi:hypothetical protein